MKEFFSNKKNVTIGVVVLVAVLVVVAAGFGLSYAFSPSKKAKLETELKEMGKGFYEDFYYDLVVNSNGVENIKKFESTGIKVDLDNLSRQNDANKEKVKDFVNDKNEECNKANTKVIIYPKDPYGKTDYKLEVQLDCGFDK